jgi:hypothetical protein
MSERLPLKEISPAFAWALSELGLVSDGTVRRDDVRTLGEFLGRFSEQGSTPTPRRAKPAQPKKQRDDGRSTEILTYLLARPGSTLAELSRALDMPVEDATTASRPVDWLILNEDELVEPLHRSESETIAATRDRARAALLAASLMAKPLSHQAYTDLLKSGRVKGPSVARIVQLFGSWTEACNLVGVESGQPLRNNYERTWDKEQLLQFVERFLLEPAFRGASHQFDEWRQSLIGVEKIPSLGTVRNIVGGTWNDIRTTALRRIRQRWISAGENA